MRVRVRGRRAPLCFLKLVSRTVTGRWASIAATSALMASGSVCSPCKI